MIKFFRKIRQNLLMENKTGKYFKYAIGEIVLVVIGILIALQINNWNQQRQNRQKETIILKQIHKDFISNKIQLDSIIINNEKSIEGCLNIIKNLPFKAEKASIDTVTKYVGDIFNVKTFNPSNCSIDALISSSSFEVIRNEELRNLLVSWKDVYNDYTEEEQYARDLQIWELLPYLRKNYDMYNPYNEVNLKLVSSIEFQNIWVTKLGSHQEILDAIKDEQVEYYINEIIRLTQNQ